MNRRRFLSGAATALLFSGISSNVHPQGGTAARITLLNDFVAALGAAGDALTKIVDSLKHLVQTGVQGYDAAKARVIHAELREISALSTSLSASQLLIARSLVDYADGASTADEVSRASAWRSLVETMQAVLTQVPYY